MPSGMRRIKSTICKWVALLSVTLLVGPFLLKSILSYNHPSHRRQDEFVWVRKSQVGNGREPLAPEEQSAAQIQNNVDEAPHPDIAKGAMVDGKIDWHDYKAIKREESRKGPGEHGIPYKLPENLKGKRDALFNANGFNALASDQIAMDRSIPDIRHKDCKKKKYLAKLPTVSVVIPFHEEHWTTLLRSVHSILNRSPPHLIKEIILVDDHSTKDFLHSDLEAYLKANATKTRVVRTAAREGLIRARLLGARESTGEVIIFLDSHIECNVNWLPPLLEPIAENPRTVVCPFIDVIAFEDFEYRAQDEGARGAFDWEFFYKRLPLLPRDLENPTEPFESPVMAGGLFAMNREFFWELGGYDEGLMIWGGEQYELSFKIWQCGGRMVDAPCSRIGHIYRKFAPFPNPGIGDFVGKNYRRVAEVWMDEYAQYLYSRRPNYLSIDTGDLTKQKELRQKLKCKPFKWFMEKVAFDLPLKYPMVEPPDYANGEIRNVHSNLCLDSKFKDAHSSLGVDNCIKDDSSAGGEQNFEWTWHRDIKPKGRELCLDVATSQPKSKVLLYPCHGMKGNQWWAYIPRQGRLYHPVHKMCLDHDPVSKDVFINHCMDEDTQNWKFESYNLTIIDKLPQ